MHTPYHLIVINQHQQAMRDEADADRLAALARHAAAKAAQHASHEHRPLGGSFGFVRRLVDRLTPA